MRCLVLLALLWPHAPAIAAQLPRDRPRAATAAPGRIVGRVISAGTEAKALRRVRVTLNGSEIRPGRTTITRDDGAFAFDGLPPGQYSLGVVKSGYVSIAYGAARPGRPGLPVTVTPGGQHAITIEMPRGAVITGLISDAAGQPLPGLQVRAMTYRILPPAGDRQLGEVPGANAVTDDRGLYRIFGLPAGDYAVAVRPGANTEAYTSGLRTVSSSEVRQALAEARQGLDRRLPGMPPARTARPVSPASPSEAGGRVAFAPVFHPGTPNPSQARLLTVRPGEERTGIDIEIDYVPVARISGTVVATSAGPAQGYVRLVADPHETVLGQGSFRGITTAADGTFAFDSVPPGRYILAARASSDGSMQLRYDAATSLWASTELIVDGRDINNIVLAPVPGITLEGRLVFEGLKRPPPRLSEFRGFGLPLSSRTSMGGSPQVFVREDGRFTVFGAAPGTYWFEFAAGIRTSIGSWWLKSVAIDGREALDAPLDLRAGGAAATVTFTDTASELRGRVTLATGEPAPHFTAVVFPVERSGWFFNSRRIAAAPADAQGRYGVRNLPPGDYLIAARNDLDQFEWFDPATLEKLAPSAAKLTIRGDEAVTFDVRVR